jgi:hypothetical protein
MAAHNGDRHVAISLMPKAVPVRVAPGDGYLRNSLRPFFEFSGSVKPIISIRCNLPPRILKMCVTSNGLKFIRRSLATDHGLGVGAGWCCVQRRALRECRKERRDFPQDVALLRDEQVVAGMGPPEHAGVRDAAFERPCLTFCHG